MGENDVTAIHQGLGEVNKKLDVLSGSFNDLRVLIASEYVKGNDFKECQKTAETRVVALHQKFDKHVQDEKDAALKKMSINIGITSIVVTLIQWAYSLMKN